MVFSDSGFNKSFVHDGNKITKPAWGTLVDSVVVEAAETGPVHLAILVLHWTFQVFPRVAITFVSFQTFSYCAAEKKNTFPQEQKGETDDVPGSSEKSRTCFFGGGGGSWRRAVLRNKKH